MLNYEPEQSAEISDTLKSEQTYTAGSFFLIKLLPNKIAIVFVFLLALILVSLCAFFSFDYTHACAHTHDTLAPMNHFNFLPQLNSSIFLCTLLLPLSQDMAITPKCQKLEVLWFWCHSSLTICRCNIFKN